MDIDRFSKRKAKPCSYGAGYEYKENRDKTDYAPHEVKSMPCRFVLSRRRGPFLVKKMSYSYTGIMKVRATLFSVLSVLIAALLFAACVSGPVQIPLDMPPAKIIQRAQEALDTNKYKIAIQYYEALGERYGDSGEYLCTAEYEIAFIHYKQKRYIEARREFESLLDRYNGVDAEFLPPSFKILAEKVLATISERGF